MIGCFPLKHVVLGPNLIRIVFDELTRPRLAGAGPTGPDGAAEVSFVQGFAPVGCRTSRRGGQCWRRPRDSPSYGPDHRGSHVLFIYNVRPPR